MNSKKIQQATDKVFFNISKMSTEDFNVLLQETPDEWGTLLLKGGFFDPLDEGFSAEELMSMFPDVRPQISIQFSFNNIILKELDVSFPLDSLAKYSTVFDEEVVINEDFEWAQAV